jgi:hypothetical protein
MAETRKSKGSCRLLALPSHNRNTLCGPRYAALSPSWHHLREKSLGVNATPLAQRDPPQLQGPVTVNPALSYRNLPIRSHYPHFAVHLDRPISASSLDRRRGREKLSRKEQWSSYEEGVHDFGYCPLRPSEGFRQTGRLAVSRSFPSSDVRRLSCQSCSWRSLIGGSSKECAWQSLVWSCCLGSAQGHAIKTNTTCAAATGKLTGSSWRVIHLRHLRHS